MNYKRPEAIDKWIKDTPNEELYLVEILDDYTVLSAYGRYAHSSGSKKVSWQEFLNGEMNELIVKTMGEAVLREVIEKLKKLT
jgi:hypothetical protein